MIEFDSVTKKFEKKYVLDEVSFKINSGETFVLLGQSGSGKTTILRHIAGFHIPDGGDVLIDGVSMAGASSAVKAKLRKKMGFLFQGGALLNWLNVRDNIALPLVEHRLFSPEERNRIVNEKLGLVQLSEDGDKMPSDISGGMKKRAGLARAIVLNPQIILYDEPTSGLDPVMSVRIDKLIKKLQSELGVTSVVVTHDMGSAYRIADRIGILYKGKMIQVGTPEEIKNSDIEVVRQFVSGGLNVPLEP